MNGNDPNAAKKWVIEGYESGVDILCEVLDVNINNKACENLKIFLKNAKDGVESASLGVKKKYMTQVYPAFRLICTLAQDQSLSKDHLQQKLLELTTYGLASDVCQAGMAENIVSAARDLNSLKEGLPQKFFNKLNAAINEHILAFMRNSGFIGRVIEEIHDVSAFFDHVAPYFDLPQREDVLASRINAQSLKQCTQYILKNITLEGVIRHMAEDCFKEIQDFYTLSHPDVKNVNLALFDATIVTQFNEEVQPILNYDYGPIDAYDVLYSEDGDNFRLTNDATFIARSIARNLRGAGIVNPFKAAYVLGQKGAKDQPKLKQIGESLVYVSETSEDSSGAKNNHLRTLLDQFVLQDRDKGQALLKRLEETAANTSLASSPLAKQIQNGYWQKLPTFLVQEMAAAPTLEDAAKVIAHAVPPVKSNSAAIMSVTAMLTDALMLAVGDGHDKVVAALCKAGADIDQVNAESGFSSLMAAADKGHDKVVAVLLEVEANISLVNNRNENALMLAATKGHNKVVALLLKSKLIAKADVDQFNKFGNTALMVAVNNGDEKVIAEFLNPSPNIKVNINSINNKNGHTAFLDAAKNGCDKIVADFLKSGLMTNNDLKYVNHAGDTALMLAASNGHDKVVAEILKSGLMTKNDLCQVNEFIDYTALMMAAYKGEYKVVAEFLKSGLMAENNLNYAEKGTGYNALMLAAGEGHDRVVAEFLNPKLKIKVDIKSILKDGVPVLMGAAAGGYAKVVALFLNSKLITKADVDYAHTQSGRTALMAAALNGCDEVVTEFLKNELKIKVNINQVDKSGNTALIFAAYSGKLEIVKKLLAAGADIKHKNNFYCNALDAAGLNKKKDVMKYLKEVEDCTIKIKKSKNQQ